MLKQQAIKDESKLNPHIVYKGKGNPLSGRLCCKGDEEVEGGLGAYRAVARLEKRP